MRHKMLTQRALFCIDVMGYAESAFCDACRTSSVFSTMNSCPERVKMVERSIKIIVYRNIGVSALSSKPGIQVLQ
jgi:Asp/Glu/hydantoin racemase